MLARNKLFSQDQMSTMLEQLQRPSTCPICPKYSSSNSENRMQATPCPKCEATECPKSSSNRAAGEGIFPKFVSKFAVGMAHTPKKNFTNKFEIGVPLDSSTQDGDRDVLFLYSKASALPTKMQAKKVQDTVELVSAEEATENCELMHVLFHHRSGTKNLCLAVVPQYEGYHLQNWMRIPKGNPAKISKDNPLRWVSRGMKEDGIDEFAPPQFERHTKETWKRLKIYLETYEDIVKRLRPVVNKIKVNNTVIVMVANFGQAQLMQNFVCSARARGFDTSNILLFATDKETEEIAQGLNLTTFHDEANFGYMTKEAAKQYGDMKFVQMMMAKVMSVHLVSLTKVDFLFQDVDMIWFKNPLDFFHNKSSPIYEMDAIFQDDGARSIRYAPWSANSGFYYVRNNHRTTNFLSQLVMSGDLILKTFSHQQALIATMAEHASLFGLKVKVLGKEDDRFPGGHHFHQLGPNSYFKRYYRGETDPIIFHMSWTLNKDDKLKYLRQLGEWYVQDQCIDKAVAEIPLNGGTLSSACCSAEPLFSCFYRDKPSKKPCHDSSTIDKKSDKDFWGKW